MLAHPKNRYIDDSRIKGKGTSVGMSHTCLCLPSYSWYSFTDPGGMEC